jgi:hypothetical protein
MGISCTDFLLDVSVMEVASYKSLDSSSACGQRTFMAVVLLFVCAQDNYHTYAELVLMGSH